MGTSYDWEKEYDACLDCFVKVDMAIEDLKERQEHMDRFIHCDEETMNKNNIVKAVPITEGMTIYFNDATSYYNEKNKLIEAGWEMISDDGEYSIYITSAPYECNNTNNATYKIK